MSPGATFVIWLSLMPMAGGLLGTPETSAWSRYIAPSSSSFPCRVEQGTNLRNRTTSRFRMRCAARAGTANTSYINASRSYQDTTSAILNGTHRDGIYSGVNVSSLLKQLNFEDAARSHFAPTFFLLGSIFEDNKDYLCAIKMFDTAAEFGIIEAAKRRESAAYKGSSTPIKQIADCSFADVRPYER